MNDLRVPLSVHLFSTGSQAMSSTMSCPSCRRTLQCGSCWQASNPGRNVDTYEYKMQLVPLCQRCNQRYLVTLNTRLDQEKEIGALRTNLAEQKKRFEDAQAKLELKLEFLKLQVPDASSECTQGDVKFVVDGASIAAHSFVLADKSRVFFTMFDSGMLEKQTGVIHIDDASFQVMEAMVKYCYTSDIVFTDEVSPDEVLRVAHKYEIDDLRNVCDEELSKRVGLENLPQMLRLSRRFEAKMLQTTAVQFFKDNFDLVQDSVLESYT